MAGQQTFVIVGASLAGASAAGALRDEGFDGEIHLIGAEEHLPYIRPPLSKEYLAGTTDRASVFVESKSWYTDRDVQFHPGTRAVDLDLAAHRVRTDDGESRRYDRLLLTTGSRPRRLTVPGATLGGGALPAHPRRHRASAFPAGRRRQTSRRRGVRLDRPGGRRDGSNLRQ
ncbi:FAD-dependent oxidoreductase [Cryobacterium serini]|uniref:FAD-dependent oxidoreductase n=1 Tax=Cryobacterium serini TaxID=1259201 RepID=UPI001F544C04|nr:FAD-dependent oxidoreductase [Cryobacterium serini]